MRVLSHTFPSSLPFAPPCKGDLYYTLLPETVKGKQGKTAKQNGGKIL
jgi:hypothetical protein